MQLGESAIMKSVRLSTFRRALLAASATLLLASAAQAQQDASTPAGTAPPSDIVDDPNIIIRNDINPNLPPPAGNLDSGVSGVGQMTIRNSPTTTSMGVCTGTLINPRTVIFAAHCVNSRPASAYGANGTPFGAHAGGTPIAFGFNADNLPAVRIWLGLDGGAAAGLQHATNQALNLYAVEQIWYDPRSLEPNAQSFLYGDIALATLDTPAFDIPTWAMLFSPIDAPTHVTITGYGNRGNANSATIAIDWRRRSAENMVSFLGSLDDYRNWLFGGGFVNNPQSLYQFTFTDPSGTYNPAAGQFDFGLFGPETALPREGTTAGGDSGGPLIADQLFDIPVILGVLSGGTRFFTAQAGHNYGTSSFYQPLFLFWDQIVANNSYVYASARQGVGAWEDPTRWVQDMDPNYYSLVDGQLQNQLPDTPALGTSGGGTKFGQVCFLDDCTTPASNPQVGSGTPIFIPGGPGSTNFVPNNVVANPSLGIRARYYDVTLSQIGTTTLSSSVTIDRMTLTGRSPRLDVRSNGTLTVLGDYTQINGTTNVDGRINAGETLMVSGLLTGSGTFNPTFLTVGVGVVSPGGLLTPGTLTIQGDVILSSASILNIELTRNATDLLRVTGDSRNPGILALNGGAVQFSRAPLGLAPRHGDSYVFATAAGGVDGEFGYVYSNLGVLNPVLTYGSNDISVKLQAGSLVSHVASAGNLQGTALAQAIASVLDLLRGNSYNNLYGLYGAIDVMDPLTLAGTLRSLAPDAAAEGYLLDNRQSRLMLNNITDRLSMLGTMPGGTLSIASDSGLFAAMAGESAPATLGFNSIVPSRAGIRALPRGMTGFVSSGYSVAGTTLGSDRLGSYGGQRVMHVGMGLETEVAPGFTMGTAFGYADGLSRPGATSRSETRTSQVAAYGSYRLGGGAYVAAVASADTSRFDLARDVAAGLAPSTFTGATETSRLTARAEAGVNLPVSRGLTLTPRVALAYSSYRLGGFREQGGEAALQVDEMNLRQAESRFGATLSGESRLSGGWRFVPQLRGDVVRLLSGADDGMMVRFANAPDYAFALPISGGDATWGEVRGGWRLINGPLEIGAALEANIGRASFRDERAVGDITFRF
jgi:subtilase-type serine protease